MALSGKAEAKRLIDGLPDDATWDDIVYAMYVHANIERGLRDADEGNLVENDVVMREIGRWLESAGRA